MSPPVDSMAYYVLSKLEYEVDSVYQMHFLKLIIFLTYNDYLWL